MGDLIRCLDHVAVAVPGRDELSQQLCERLGWQVIERNDRLTLLGPTPDAGKLTLIDPGPVRMDAQPGDDGAAPAWCEVLVTAVDGDVVGTRIVVAPGLVLALVAPPDDGATAGVREVVGLHVAVPEQQLERLAAAWSTEPWGLRRAGADALATGERGVLRLVAAGGGRNGAASADAVAQRLHSARLDHVGLLVDDARCWADRLQAGGGVDVDLVDAPASVAVFATVPGQVRLEYVEHKQAFHRDRSAGGGATG